MYTIFICYLNVICNCFSSSVKISLQHFSNLYRFTTGSQPFLPFRCSTIHLHSLVVILFFTMLPALKLVPISMRYLLARSSDRLTVLCVVVLCWHPEVLKAGVVWLQPTLR